MRALRLSAFIVACATLAAQQAHAQSSSAGATFFDRFCVDHGESGRHAKFVEWLPQRLGLNNDQRTLFNEFEDARAKALVDSKTKLCADKPDLTSFEARLDFGQSFLEARLDALKSENPKLIAFYKSLDPKQKKEFDDIRAQIRH